MDLVQIYNYFSDDNADDVTEHLDKIVEEIGSSPDAENLCSNLLEVHSKNRSRVKENLTNVIAPLLQIPAPKKKPQLVRYFLGFTVYHGAYGYQVYSSE